MCDRIARGARRLHQLLKPIEHCIHRLRQGVKLIAGAADRRAARKVAAHDFARRVREVFGAARSLRGGEKAADERDDDADNGDGPEHLRDAPGDDGAVAQIASDKQDRPIDQPAHTA